MDVEDLLVKIECAFSVNRHKLSSDAPLYIQTMWLTHMGPSDATDFLGELLLLAVQEVEKQGIEYAHVDDFLERFSNAARYSINRRTLYGAEKVNGRNFLQMLQSLSVLQLDVILEVLGIFDRGLRMVSRERIDTLGEYIADGKRIVTDVKKSK